MDIDINKIDKIIDNHHRFTTPFSEPYGYYIQCLLKKNL